LEKKALESKVKNLSSELADTAANSQARIRDLTEERNDLVEKLDTAKAKNSTVKVTDAAAQIAALNNEVNTLRSRIDVDESKPVPFSDEELALFRQDTNPEPIRKSIEQMPAGTAELVASAQQHFSNNEFDQAEADYQKILQRDQNNGLALANIAAIEMQENKLDAAEKHIKAALVQSPEDAYNLATLGFLKFRQEKYDDALDALSHAAKLDPQNPEIQNYLGVTLSHKGLRAQAETALRKALQIDPNYAPAHNNIAVIYLSQNPPLPQLAPGIIKKRLPPASRAMPNWKNCSPTKARRFRCRNKFPCARLFTKLSSQHADAD
jgi:tetratricopeptide (TPR) repeat protein